MKDSHEKKMKRTNERKRRMMNTMQKKAGMMI